MKPEFTEVLLPDGKGKYPVSSVPDMLPPVPCVQVGPGNTSGHGGGGGGGSRLFAGLITAGLLVLIVLGLGIGLITRYESKFAVYENRISALETELALFFEQLEGQDEHHSQFPQPTSLSQSPFLVTTHHDPLTGSYEDEEEEGVPLLLDESDEGILDEDDEDDENEAEEIVFGKVRIGNRKKRQIPGYQGPTVAPNSERSKEGVAIIEGSYGGKEQKPPAPTESEGLRLYESLITTGGQGEPKAPEFAESEGSNVQPYHRSSAVWTEKDESTSTGSGRRRLEMKSGDTGESVGSSRFGENPFYVRSNSPHSQHYSGAMASRRSSSSQGRDVQDSSSAEQNPNVILRNSRVPATGESLYPRPAQHRSRSPYPYAPLKKIGQGDGEVIARVHQERKELDEESDPDEAAAGAGHRDSSAFAVSRSYKGGFTRPSVGRDESTRRHHRGGGSLRKGHPDFDAEELNVVQAEAWAEGPKTIAAHFVADPSNFSISHRHYEGNGRLRNADGIFSSWRPADWMGGSEVGKEFALSPTGVLTVKRDGLYWVYAQIHYLDSHDINGFVIQVNTEPFLTCTRMTETVPGTTAKSNTCFTAGLNYLKENDRLLIRDIETNRFSIIKPEKSFFGLMRIGDLAKR